MHVRMLVLLFYFIRYNRKWKQDDRRKTKRRQYPMI